MITNNVIIKTNNNDIADGNLRAGVGGGGGTVGTVSHGSKVLAAAHRVGLGPASHMALSSLPVPC